MVYLFIYFAQDWLQAKNGLNAKFPMVNQDMRYFNTKKNATNLLFKRVQNVTTKLIECI